MPKEKNKLLPSVADTIPVKHSSRIILSQSALHANIKFLRKQIGGKPIISLVVKANAYGHGMQQIVPMAEACGIEHFFVSSSYEAYEVRQTQTQNNTIVIMGILYDRDLPWIIQNNIEFFIFDLQKLRKAISVAKKVDRPTRVHLELETGGNRTGLPTKKLSQAVALIRKNKRHIRFSGLCTHLAGAEALANKFRIVRQIKEFDRITAQLKKRRTKPQLIHMANSSAALSLPKTTRDLVRIGVSAYGFWPSPDIYNLHLMRINKTRDNPLKRVLTWKTNIMHIKSVKKDEFIGYSTSYQATRKMKIAVIPVGYANGYPREMSNKGHVLIRGKKARITGLINMNLFMVDVTKIPGAKIGDEVVLIGRQNNNIITVSSFSEFSSALNTEFLSRLPTTIPRSVG